MRKKIANSSIFILSSLVSYLCLFFIYGDIKLQNLEFAGEPVPTNTYKLIEKKIVWNNKQFFKRLYIKNMEKKHMNFIDEEIQKAGLPKDLRYIPYVESGLNENAVSGAGAVGLWQLMPETGKTFGMKITEDFDERYNKEISTGVALEYLINLRDQFPSWTLSVAAYNRGENGLRRDIEAGKTEDFYELLTAEETKNYIFKMLAYKYGR